jgi:hypothetical protein
MSSTYTWQTDIIKTRTNAEKQRVALIGCPSESYQFGTELSNAQIAVVLSALAYQGALGSAFGVALTYEALLVTADSPGTTIAVNDTTLADWAYPGARAVLVKSDGSLLSCVVQSASPTSIVIDVAAGTFGNAGNRIMPVAPCYLEPQQGLGHYLVNAGRLELRARAILFGNASGDWSPAGAPAITTYTDPVTSVVYPVWDRSVDLESATELADRAVMLGNEIVSRGAKISNVGRWVFGEFARGLSYVVKTDSDRQWLKSFLGTIKGRQKPFLLSTYEPDLVIASGDASTGTLTVYGPPTLGAGDWVNTWRRSSAHRWLQFTKSDGSIVRRRVMDQTDNGNGTQDILLDSSFAGAIAKVSFLELCRLESDEITVEWKYGHGVAPMTAHVVQA